MSHTPGPWGYSFDKKDTGFEGDTFMAGPLHCDGTGGFSSVVEGGLVLADDNENEANARLIAAAPTLLEALTEISKRCPPLPEGFDEFATISDFGGNADDYAAHVEKLISATTGDIARAAINAATGGQQ
jgi:hypothetical protein